MKYVYPAIFYAAKEGGYVVEFPDVQGAVTQGDTLYEAMEMAEDALAGMLVCYEDSKAGKLQPPMTNRVAEPTPLEKVVAEPDEYSTLAFVVPVKADTDLRDGVGVIREQQTPATQLRIPGSPVTRLDACCDIKDIQSYMSVELIEIAA